MDDHHHGDHHHGDNHGRDNPVANATTQLATMLMAALTSTLAPSIAPSTADSYAAHHDHAHHHEGHSTNMPGDMHMVPMKMYFHTGFTERILFEEWVTNSTGGMVGAVIGVIILALMYEGLKFLREQLYRHQYTRLSYSTCAVTANNMQIPGPAELHKITQNKLLSWQHLLQTALHVTQVLFSYFLMLIFMTFNIWLCLGILIGSGMGFFLFGWRKATIVDVSDHCH